MPSATTRPTARTTATAIRRTIPPIGASRGRPTIRRSLETRRRVQRAMLATVFFSHGTPMLLGGDEFGRTQRGNNNAYCQDNEISWLDWNLAASPEGEALTAVRRAPRGACASAIRSLRSRHFLHGKDEPAPGILDIAWFDRAGKTISPRGLEQPGRAAPRRCAAPPATPMEPLAVLTLFLNPTGDDHRFRVPPPTLPDARARRQRRAGRSRNATSMASEIDGRDARSARSVDERPQDELQHDCLSHARSAVRRYAPVGGPHALPPVGAGAAKRVARDRGREPVPMARDADGWFEAEAHCGAGTRYRYRLADGLAVPDPASRAQADDVHGPSLVVDPRAYAWRIPEWKGRPWRETVLYELHAGTLWRLRRRAGGAARLGRAWRHRGRADADQRFSRQAQLGLRRRAALRAGSLPTARRTS